ncbi:MAG: excinuclease ABC subunit UvrA [Mycoplasmataceae bacterium]|nr:excinuclease ABC subunit UvrA [Mycoplasmataceae bacterium]
MKGSMEDKIIIKGARENNLKNIDLEIPKNKLVVITGLSGSGKSSLAFDTIYAEGQRRYLESLSSYARQFLGGNDKPDVDLIEGLSPAISIDQKSTSHNPRSTVGTVTEIYDYLRVLFARVGTPYCPNGHGPIETLTTKQILNKIINSFKDDDKLQILSPIVRRQKGTFKTELEKLKTEGFLRVRIDGKIYSLDEKLELEKNKFHDLDILVDRIIGHKDNETTSRINDALETALKYGEGKVVVICNDKETNYSQSHSCKVCGFTIPEMEPRLFSFNSPIGACPECHGLGFTYEPDRNKMIPDKNLSINDGGLDYFKNTVNTTSLDWLRFEALLKHYKIDKKKPLGEFTKKELDLIMHGSDEPIHIDIKSSGGIQSNKYDYAEGVLSLVKRRHLETSSEMARQYYAKYLSETPCKICKGKKLSPAALCVKIGGKDIIEVTELAINECIDFLLNLKLTDQQNLIAKLALKEIIDRLTFLDNVGLSYLTLSRNAITLSGGEAQRIRLATQIGSSLTGVLYVLDEPSIGLHQRDNDRLIAALKKMRDLGNTLLVVEHDAETMKASDYIVDIGPGAGNNGGKVVAVGTPKEIMNNPKSLTGQYLKGDKFIPIPKTRRSGNGRKIVLKGAKENNLKNLDVTFPLGKFIVVTGVSGSGKSTLINETLAKNIQKKIFSPFVVAPTIKSIDGIYNIDKLIMVSQEPIGRTPRSNPATYVGVFDDIRELYSQLPESKIRGYTKSRFSFNVPGGRCEKCWGDGVIKIEMHFLPDVYVTCTECNGKKYNDETLAVKYKGKSIYDVLEMSVSEALEFFGNIPSIRHKLELMNDVGLGYIKLGTSGTDLSGGEAQRVKLAKFLQKKSSDNTLLILDEPTTGLHTHDIQNLIDVLNRIVDNGSTVIVIEHNLDLIKCADYIIDLGPEGGAEGGKVVATGTPEQIVSKADVSYTAQYLKNTLK